MTAEGPGAAEYILPLRWTEDSALPDLADLVAEENYLVWTVDV